MVLPDFVEQYRTFTYNTQSGFENLPFVFTSIGIRNDGDKELKIYFSKYNRDNFVLVPANSYKEVAVSSNYFEFVYTTPATSPSVVIEVVYLVNDHFLVNRFPNLFVRDINNNYVQYNPLNTGGFFTETYAYGTSTNRPYNSDTIIKVDYWLNGQKISTDSGNFYLDLFNVLVYNFITQNFSFSDVNEVLAPLPGGQTTDLIQRIKNWWESIDRPLNDEYVGGWAKVETFDRKLSLISFVLDAGDKIEYPFTLLGFNIENLTSLPAQVIVHNASTSNTVTINANDTYTGNFEPANRFEVVSGKVRITFSGHLVKMLEFAPIINIFYPLGFDETSGVPNDAYTKFLNDLASFEAFLAGIKFSGRVIKYKWVSHRAQESDVWNADYQKIRFLDQTIKLPFPEIRPLLRDWYAYAKIEDFIIEMVHNDNYSVLGPYNRPRNLEEVVNNDNITFVLGKDFSSVPPPQRAQEKRKFLLEVLKEQYLGQYAGSLTSGYFVS